MKWSEIAVVILPPLEKHSTSFVKILSIRVAEFEDTREGCKIRGRKPYEDT